MEATYDQAQGARTGRLRMIRHDLTHWPLVVTLARGAATVEDQIDFLAHWDTWLDRGEPFATLRIFADTDAHLRPRGGAQEIKAWLAANRERIRRLVWGMATVVFPAHYEWMNRIDAEKLFGVPARLFVDAGSALDWLGEVILLPRPIRLDRLAILSASVSLDIAIRHNASQISQHDDHDDTQASAHQTR